VYVSLDEFKARFEIVRGSARIPVAEHDFDHPWLQPHFVTRTGGTRSQGTLIPMQLQFIADSAPDLLLALKAHDRLDADFVVWQTAPFFQFFRFARVGGAPGGWFHPIQPLHWKARVLGEYVHAIARTAGLEFPRPIWNALDDPGKLANWLVARQAAGRTLVVTAYASSAVRIALAAHERGQTLEGVTFIAHGEPFTEGKQRALLAAGAQVLVRYSTMESGTFGWACAQGEAPDDCHFAADSHAMIQQPRQIGDGPEVGAFLMTSLLGSAPKILLNAETGDHAKVERRSCGCELESVGLDLHLSNIRSHEKLTSEGMTFVATRLIDVVEQVLPARVGGTSADYQVLEEEGEHGILRLSLLVSPRVGDLESDKVKQIFLEELGRGSELEAYMARIWEQAGTVEVRREAPVPTRGGKILPFHLVRQTRSARQRT
jgi:hypothetical protein